MASIFGAFKFLTLWKHVRLSRYKAEKEATAAQLASLRHALSASQALVREKEARVGSLEEDVGNAKKRLEKITRELELSRVQNQTLVERGKSLATEVQWLNVETQRLNHGHTQTVELLQTRTAELKGAQAFLAKADHLSGADVIGMVEGLNSEIMQIAAFMAPIHLGVSEFSAHSPLATGIRTPSLGRLSLPACSRALSDRVVDGFTLVYDHHPQCPTNRKHRIPPLSVNLLRH